MENDEHILLIDDDKSLLKSYTLILTGLGYQVDSNHDPLEALKKFENNATDYDLIISDIHYCEKTGKATVPIAREGCFETIC